MPVIGLGSGLGSGLRLMERAQAGRQRRVPASGPFSEPELAAEDLPRVLRRLPHQVRCTADLAGGPPSDRGPVPARRQSGATRRDAGNAAASWVFDGNTPEEEYQRVLRGIEEGDPAVLCAAEPPAIGPDSGDLARDLGIEPGDRSLPRAVSAYSG